MSASPFDDITPDRAGEGRAPEPAAAIDRMADQRGFVSRELPEIAIKRTRGTERTVHQFTMRVRVTDSNRFVKFCESERLSYREGFEKLMDLLAAHQNSRS
jgi:hypothetical protein